MTPPLDILPAMLKRIDVTDLPDPLVAAIEAMIRTYRERIAAVVALPDTPSVADPRPIGWMRGKIDMTEAFFEPLPDDLLDAFNGEDNLKGRP